MFFITARIQMFVVGLKTISLIYIWCTIIRAGELFIFGVYSPARSPIDLLTNIE